MSAKSNIPATVARLDLGVVTEVLARHAVNLTGAAADLGVPPSDLRRLLWANPRLQDEAFEVVERRLDKAEKNIAEALNSEDSRRRNAASFFVLRNSARAKRRGWITSSSTGVDVNVSVNTQPQRYVFRWRTAEEEERAKAEAALETFRLRLRLRGLSEHNPDLADAPDEPAEDDDGWKPPTYG
jgi:hypothetical protein